MSRDDVAFYGFTPVPRDPDVLFKDHPTASGPNPKQDLFTADDFPFPDSAVVRAVKDFVKVARCSISRLPTADRRDSQKELDEQTYNHSNRVYIYGTLSLHALCSALTDICGRGKVRHS